MNNDYFNKMALLGFQYKPGILDVKKVRFDEEQDIHRTHRKSRKIQSVTDWYRCGKCDAMDPNVECLSCGEVEPLKYFQLSE